MKRKQKQYILLPERAVANEVKGFDATHVEVKGIVSYLIQLAHAPGLYSTVSCNTKSFHLSSKPWGDSNTKRREEGGEGGSRKIGSEIEEYRKIHINLGIVSTHQLDSPC